MKTFFRVTMLGLLMFVMTAFSAIAVMAQDDDQKEKTALYTCFVENYDKYTMDNQKKALGCAKDYIAKFPDDTQYVDYFKTQIPPLEKWISDKEKIDRENAEFERKKKERADRIKRFNNSYKTAAESVTVQNWQEYFAAADEVIKNDKDVALNVQILSAVAGEAYLARAKTPIDTFNNKIIDYAEDSIKGIESGNTAKGYGTFNFTFDTKDAALAGLNKVIGYIQFDRQKKEADGVAHYYKALQYDKDWRTYRIIGAWYLSKAATIGKIRTSLDAKDEANLPKIKEYLAMERGYAARAIDAYARSYSLAKADTKLTAENKKDLYDRLKGLFEFRFTQPGEEAMKTEISINNYVATVNAKEMPNPKTEVEPIALEEPKPETEKPADSTKDDAKSEVKDGAKSEMKKEAGKTSKNGTTRSRTVSKVKPDNK